MKLGLKHLAAYLPHLLTIRVYRANESLFVEDLVLNGEILDYLFENSHQRNNSINIYKPILRPLSDLTKEQREELNEIDDQITLTANHQHFKTNEGSYLDPEQVPYNYAVKLLEWHFDMFGLIDTGLAVNINTVKL